MHVVYVLYCTVHCTYVANGTGCQKSGTAVRFFSLFPELILRTEIFVGKASGRVESRS